MLILCTGSFTRCMLMISSSMNDIENLKYGTEGLLLNYNICETVSPIRNSKHHQTELQGVSQAQ